MDTKEIRKALNGYYNLCMDEFDGHAKEEAIEMYIQKSYPWEKAFRRKGEIISKYPHLKEMLMNDPTVKNWLESWSRTDLSMEEGLALLTDFLQKEKEQYRKTLEDHMMRNPNPTIIG